LLFTQTRERQKICQKIQKKMKPNGMKIFYGCHSELKSRHRKREIWWRGQGDTERALKNGRKITKRERLEVHERVVKVSWQLISGK
jgi:hypothetical protein